MEKAAGDWVGVCGRKVSVGGDSGVDVDTVGVMVSETALAVVEDGTFLTLSWEALQAINCRTKNVNKKRGMNFKVFQPWS